MVEIFKARSVMERDALLNALTDACIEAFGTVRDMSKKMTNSTVDISLGYVSTLMNEFSIFVPHENAIRANEVIKIFLKETSDFEKLRQQPINFLSKFYSCCVYTVYAPGICHVLAIINLIKGLKNKEKIKPVSFVGSSIIFLISSWVAWYLFVNLVSGIINSN